MTSNALPLVGWREWVFLQSFDDTPIKAKVDTGARTSALHAFQIDTFNRDNQLWVRFGLHPRQQNTDYVVTCEAPVKDRRQVTDSGGHKEMRYVIETLLSFNGQTFVTEVTLTDRENMRFRMLLGRTALKKRYLVDSGRSFILGGDQQQPPRIPIR